MQLSCLAGRVPLAVLARCSTIPYSLIKGSWEDTMKKNTITTKAGQQYAIAYETHYTAKKLGKALQLYQAVLGTYPEALEAKYSRTQILNIIRTVVPEQTLFDTHVELASTQLNGAVKA